MEMSVSIIAIVTAIIVSFLTVLISAWVPSKRASKASAIETIRQIGDIKVKQGKARTSKLTGKLFGVPGVIAQKYYKRSRKKYRATIFSLFLSIVIFVSASSFSDGLMEGVESYYGTKDSDRYDLSFYVGFDESAGGLVKISSQNNQALGDRAYSLTLEQLFRSTEAAEGVTESAYAIVDYYSGWIEQKYLTDRAISELQKKEREYLDYVKTLFLGKSGSETQRTEGDGSLLVQGSMIFVNDDQFRKLLKENDL